MIFTESERIELLKVLRQQRKNEEQDLNTNFALTQCVKAVADHNGIEDVIAFLDSAMNTLDFLLQNLAARNEDLPMLQDAGVRFGYIAAFRGYMERYKNEKE
jgi:hypothetical protein